jgi:hypothetical protein
MRSQWPGTVWRNQIGPERSGRSSAGIGRVRKPSRTEAASVSNVGSFGRGFEDRASPHGFSREP